MVQTINTELHFKAAHLKHCVSVLTPGRLEASSCGNQDAVNMNELCFCWETSKQEMFVRKIFTKGAWQLFRVGIIFSCWTSASVTSTVHWDVGAGLSALQFLFFTDRYWLTGIFTAVSSACVQLLIGIDPESQATLSAPLTARLVWTFMVIDQNRGTCPARVRSIGC